MSGSTARRGEAHLWLLLEEALTSIRRGGAPVDEVRRNVHAVTGALAAAEVVPPGVAHRLETEFGNILAVRGLTPLAGFTAHDPEPVSESTATAIFDASPPSPPSPPVRDGAGVWLEAEIDRHLDLLAAFDPTSRPSAGTEALRMLAGPVRAFEASRALDRPGRALIDDFAATLAEVGYEVRRPARASPKRDGRARSEWVDFLRQALGTPADGFEPRHTRNVDAALGDVRPGLSVQLTRISWTADALELVARIRSERLDATRRVLQARDVLDLEAVWSCRVTDDRDGLHLGQPTRARYEGGSATRFVLRPGLAEGTSAIAIAITVGGRNVTGKVEW